MPENYIKNDFHFKNNFRHSDILKNAWSWESWWNTIQLTVQ